MRTRPGFFHRRFSRLRDEGGFTLVELMVAMGVILVALLAMAYTASIGFADIALARQRQSANGLANEAMEEVRALPFDTLKKGLSNTDLTNSLNPASPAYDPGITLNSGCGTPTVYCYQGEAIPRGSNPNVVPLVPHKTSVVIGPSTYTTKVYVTYYRNDATLNAYRITVVVSWTKPARRGVSTSLQTQSVAFSGGGCLSTATHPFAAPCQPFLYGTASRAQGHFDITGTINGIELEEANLFTPTWSANSQVEQISATQSLASGSQISLDLLSGSPSTSGGQRFTSSANNDPSQPGLDYATASGSGTAGTLSTNGSGNTFALVGSSGDPLTTVSTTKASIVNPSNPCPLSGSQTDQQPCGRSTGQQVGAMTATLSTNPGKDLGTVNLASVAAAPSVGSAYVNRDVQPNVDGLMHADATRSMGTVQIAALPSKMDATKIPAGWAGYLVQISGFSDSVTAETGTNSAAPTVTTAGTIQYWNGVNGYVSRAIATGVPANLAVGSVHIVYTDNGKVVQIDVQGSVDNDCNVWVAGCPTTGGTSTAQTFQSGCSPACPNTRTTAAATSNSPFQGDIHYTITYDGVVQAHLTVHVDLGTLLVSNSYQAAPSAS